MSKQVSDRKRPSAGSETLRSSSPSRMGNFSFGSFYFSPGQQELLDGRKPVKLGARALELLGALIERPGEVVSKSELMARIWPGTIVEEGNLKVQVATLRRALGDGRDGTRYVATANGRGYRFVAPVNQCCAKPNAVAGRTSASSGATPPLGRCEVLEVLRSELAARRFVTIVGPGGIGKTTVATELANSMVRDYRDGVRIVDFATLQMPHLVADAVRKALDPSLGSKRDAKALPLLLKDKRQLIVLDSCEHLVDAIATIAEEIVRLAPGVHILATSRVPLRVTGEIVYRLGPLAVPPQGGALTARDAMRFPAVRLFVERAASAQHRFELTNRNARDVAEICRRLDGIALAIELAARRTDAFPPSKLLSLLSDRFDVLDNGREAGPPRHEILTAAIDWSYDLLQESERAFLRRLSIFLGSFTLESGAAVAALGHESEAATMASIANLVAKSLVSAEASDRGGQYRLLGPMRAYARQKLVQSGEYDVVAGQHARHYLALFRLAEREWQRRPQKDWISEHRRSLDDVRSALDWAFSADGDVDTGVALAAAAIPFWSHLSFIDECRRQAERALDASRGRAEEEGRSEMKLSTALGAAIPRRRPWTGDRGRSRSLELNTE